MLWFLFTFYIYYMYTQGFRLYQLVITEFYQLEDRLI